MNTSTLAHTALSLFTRTGDPCLATTKLGHLFSISVGYSLTTESDTHHHTYIHTCKHEWGFMCSLIVENSRIGGASDVTNGREAIRRLFDRYGEKINTHTRKNTTVCVYYIYSRALISLLYLCICILWVLCICYVMYLYQRVYTNTTCVHLFVHINIIARILHALSLSPSLSPSLSFYLYMYNCVCLGVCVCVFVFVFVCVCMYAHVYICYMYV
jgi:hypothetical protein